MNEWNNSAYTCAIVELHNRMPPETDSTRPCL